LADDSNTASPFDRHLDGVLGQDENWAGASIVSVCQALPLKRDQRLPVRNVTENVGHGVEKKRGQVQGVVSLTSLQCKQ